MDSALSPSSTSYPITSLQGIELLLVQILKGKKKKLNSLNMRKTKCL